MKELRFRSTGGQLIDTECTERDGGVVARYDASEWHLTGRGIGLLGRLLNDWSERNRAETTLDQSHVPPGVVTGKFRQLHDYAEELRKHFASILNDPDE